jgi:hypothetical protein
MGLQWGQIRDYIDLHFRRVDDRFMSQEKAVAAALAAAKEAVAKAETATEKRFESVNEFRGALNDSSRLLMPRTEAEMAMAEIRRSVADLDGRIKAKEDRGRGMNQGWVILVAGIGLISSIISLVYLISGNR